MKSLFIIALMILTTPAFALEQAPPIQYTLAQAPPTASTCNCTVCTCNPCTGNCNDLYAIAQQNALKANRKLLVGVGMNPPQGNWDTIRVDTLKCGCDGPCIIVSEPDGTRMAWTDTLKPSVTYGNPLLGGTMTCGPNGCVSR